MTVNLCIERFEKKEDRPAVGDKGRRKRYNVGERRNIRRNVIILNVCLKCLANVFSN